MVKSRTEATALARGLALFMKLPVLCLFLSSAAGAVDCNAESQQGQDVWVASILSGGTYVELGANDGITLANTAYLDCLGWTGVCIEPTSAYERLRESGRTCKMFKEAVAGNVRSATLIGATGIADVDLSSDGTLWSGLSDHFELKSTIAPGIQDSYSANLIVNGDSSVVETKTLADILDNAGMPEAMDFLSLDVEGAEVEILESFPWSRRSFKVMTVEHSYVPAYQTAIERILTAAGYVRAMCLGSDDGYVRADLLETSLSSVKFDDRECSQYRVAIDCSNRDKDVFCSSHPEVPCEQVWEAAANHCNAMEADHGWHAFVVVTDSVHSIYIYTDDGVIEIELEKKTDVKKTVDDFCQIHDHYDCEGQLSSYIEKSMNAFHETAKARALAKLQ